MKTSIETFIATLSEWGNSLSGKGNDYPTVLFIMLGHLGVRHDLKIEHELTIAEREELLKKRLYELVEGNNIFSSIIVMGLTQYLSNWLNHDSTFTMRNLSIAEEMAADAPGHKGFSGKVEQLRSVEYNVHIVKEYYDWVKLSVTNLGADSIKQWESEELLNMSK